jgi:hypothetical protein
VISENVGDGIYSGFNSSPIISYNNITDNEGYAVRNVDQSFIVLAENNWWGDATGPYNQITNPGGLGDTVSHYVDYDPWMTSPGTHELTPLYPPEIILQVSPNPFYHSTDIRYQISDNRQTHELKVYDIAGRLVADLHKRKSVIGYQLSVEWDGKDDAGRRLPSGVYFLKFVVGESTETIKLVLLR